MERMRFPLGRWVLVFMLVSIALWATMIYGTLAHLRQLAGGLDPFDVRPFGYDSAQARTLLDALGESGRDFYARVQLWFDTVYPATYAVSRAIVMWWFTVPGRLTDAPVPLALRILLIVPSFATATFDYAENAEIGRMLAAGPNVHSDVIEAASRMTVLKSMVGVANETVVLVLAVIVGLRWRRGRRR
jgi:hypothetical protein